MFGIPICCGKLMEYVGETYETVKSIFGGTKRVKKKQYRCTKCDNYKDV